MFHGSRGRWTAVFLLVSILSLSWVTVKVRSALLPVPPEGPGMAYLRGEETKDQSEDLTAGQGEVQPPSGEETKGEGAGQPASEEEPKGAAAAYDFSQPAPEGEAVDNSYFEDAAFVGDSRTDGFLIYSGIGRGKNLTSNGLSIFQLKEKKALTIEGKKYTLLEALALEQYSKVYLSLGVNELGYYDDEGFYLSYCQAIDAIRAVQPEAVIYIQNLIPLNEGMIAQTTGRTYLTNAHLRVYNELIQKVAEEKQVVLLDLYSSFVNEDGELPAEGSKDGVHLSKAYCQQWLAYLQTHTVEFETLYPDGAPRTGETDQGIENGSVIE